MDFLDLLSNVQTTVLEKEKEREEREEEERKEKELDIANEEEWFCKTGKVEKNNSSLFVIPQYNTIVTPVDPINLVWAKNFWLKDSVSKCLFPARICNQSEATRCKGITWPIPNDRECIEWIEMINHKPRVPQFDVIEKKNIIPYNVPQTGKKAAQLSLKSIFSVKKDENEIEWDVGRIETMGKV
jgi:hypothetical protein